MSVAETKPTFSFSQINTGFKRLPPSVQNFANATLGMGILLLLWWIGGILIQSNPDTEPLLLLLLAQPFRHLAI